MLLSEAMRLGAMLRPQGFGSLASIRKRWFRKTVTTCALGAAYEAGNFTKTVPIKTPQLNSRGTGLVQEGEALVVPDQWSELLWRRVPCPACKDFDVIGPMHRIIAMHLNDSHRWTRQQIADWVFSIEQSMGFVNVDTESTVDFAQSQKAPQA